MDACLLSRRLATALFLSVPITAQATGWNIPERGVVEFERTTDLFAYMRPPDPALSRGYTMLKAGAEGGEIWRYAHDKPSGDWLQPSFDDAHWASGRSAFGTSSGVNEDQRTIWTGEHRTIYLRNTFIRPTGKSIAAAIITVSHDDGVKIWLNGKLIIDDNGYHLNEAKVLRPDQIEFIQPGINHLAVQCTNNTGPQVIDIGLRLYPRPVGKTPVQGIREQAGRGERRGLFRPLRSPPLLFQSDLDPLQQHPTRTPWDLRDLIPFIAFDLERATARQRNYKAKCPRMRHFGDVLVEGKIDRLSSSGRQQMTLRLKSAAPDPNGDSKRFMSAHVHRFCRLRLKGTLTIERQVDVERGLVTGFTAKLEATSKPDEGSNDQERILRYNETWTLKNVRANRDAQFRKDVLDAITRGSSWIKKDIANVAGPHISNTLRRHPARSANSGRLALALLTLVKADVPRNDAVLVKAFADLKRHNILDTYSLGNAIGALEALHAPIGERDDLINGLISRPRPRKPPTADMVAIRRWANQIIANIDRRVDKGYLVRFNYTPANRYDNSVNQYGLLGLYSAHLCGVNISAGIWQAAAAHLINDQVTSKQYLRLNVSTYQDLLAAQKSPDSPRTSAMPRARIGGWGYTGTWQGLRPPVTGSMTTAGLTGLVICRAALGDLDLKRATIIPKIDQALDQGYAWLADNFDVAANPGDLARGHHWTYYYLYGLERACELAAVAQIQGHDWYFEGAMTLLHWQDASGVWPPEVWTQPTDYGFGLERSCFAVLFLKKSALPVYSLRRK